MNLNGRNVELTLKETHLRHVVRWSAKAVYKYQYKNVFVTLRFWQSSDYISAVPAILVVQSGRSSRRYRVEVAPQCD